MLHPYPYQAWSEGWQAHSVRRESCNADSSPEPSAAGSEGEEPRTGFCVILFGTGGAASGLRYPWLFTGRPYGTGGLLGEARGCQAREGTAMLVSVSAE